MSSAHQPPRISPLVLRLFRRVVRRYFRRHFRAVLAQYPERLQQTTGSLIVYGNHSSWWDPMLIVLLGDLLLPGRRHFAPIDAQALRKYKILNKIGLFPIDDTPRGAARFLRTAEAILRAGGILWLTPQGRFADPREPHLAFKPGLGALARRLPHVPLLPLAVEYTFWNERLPEALLHIAQPLHLPANQTTTQATETLETALAAAMQALQAAAIDRNPAAFTPLLTGSRGAGGIYGLVRRISSLLTRTPFDPDHTGRMTQ